MFVNEPMGHDLRSRLATGGREIRTPADRGIAGAAFREGALINVQDAQTDPRFYGEIDRQTGFTTRTLLAVPLRGIDNEVIGVLELLNKRGGTFTATDEELALTLGSLTGVTLQRQILFDQVPREAASRARPAVGAQTSSGPCCLCPIRRSPATTSPGGHRLRRRRAVISTTTSISLTAVWVSSSPTSPVMDSRRRCWPVKHAR